MRARLTVLGSLIAVVASLFAQSASAQLLYATDTAGDQLVQINRSTGAATIVGPFGFDAGAAGADFDNSGALWALLNDPGAGTSNLYKIDITTGAATFVVTLDRTLVSRGIAFAPDGVTLYATGSSDLYRVDINTGTTTLIGNMGFSAANLASSNAGVFYCLDGGPHDLHIVNVATAATTVVGPTAGNSANLTYDDSANKLLSVATGNLVEIDPSNGATTVVGPLGIGLSSVPGLAYLDTATPTDETSWGRIKRLYR